jgi:hypothetical protein
MIIFKPDLLQLIYILLPGIETNIKNIRVKTLF